MTERLSGLEEQVGVDAVLDALYAERGLDFRLYRRSTVERRLNHRLSALRISDCRAYLDVLARDPAEFDRLVEHLTLKVTGFFRNPPVFNLLRGAVLPALLAEQEMVTIWSAGCATGEEPYSLAILVEELLEGREHRPAVRIVGSDIDARALQAARLGRYAAVTLGELPAGILDRWFLGETGSHGTFYTLCGAPRRVTGYVLHNLVDAVEPPEGGGPAGFDLVLCRNVLIYFERNLQEQVVALLNRSLRPGGYLVLGEAEGLPHEIEALYHCLDRRGRVYQRAR